MNLHVSGGAWARAHLRELRQPHPSALLRRLARSERHNESNQAILARARRRPVLHEAVDECEGLSHVGLLVTAHEEVVGQVRVAREVGGVEPRGVRVHVVRLHHGLGAEDLGALVLAVGRLAADVDDGLLAVRVADDDVRRVVGLGALELFVREQTGSPSPASINRCMRL